MKNITKYLISTLMLLTMVFLNHSLAFAQDTSEDQINEILTNIEDERTKDLENQLTLNLPIETDNPNFVMTFTDPSGRGVYIQVDGKDYVKIDSPYTFQTLGIGQHSILLKFNDNQSTQQILEKKLVIIPRSPQIKAPEISNGILTVKGTGIALGSVEIVLTNGVENFRGTVEIDLKGYWTHNFENITTDGKYTLFASIRKNGYASKLSEAMSFELAEDQIGGTSTATTTLNTSAISFKFSDFQPKDIQSIIAKNPDLIIYTGVQVILGMILGLFLAKIGKSKDLKKTETLLKSAFTSKNNIPDLKEDSNINGTTITLIDKLKKSGLKNTGQKEGQHLDNNIQQHEISNNTEPESIVKVDKNEAEDKNQTKVEKKEKVSLFSKIFKKKDTSIKSKSLLNDLNKNVPENIKEDILDTKENVSVLINEPAEEPIKFEEAKTETAQQESLSKDDFLKKFKDFDPDDEQGREVKSTVNSNKKTKKRNIKISLTSENK